jgi:beta-galactosidase
MTHDKSPRERLLMDPEWRFHRGDYVPAAQKNQHGDTYSAAMAGAAGGFAGAECDDSAWRDLDLPHDFAVEGIFDPANNLDHASLPAGVGWYRKTFFLPEEDRGRRLALVFDGVYRNCTVWVNGHILRTHPSGYIGFRYDITDIADYGGANVVAVRVDATEFEGWWYEGAGIYRHVWLEKTGPVRVAPEGVFVHAEVAESGNQVAATGRATVKVLTTVENYEAGDCACAVQSVVLDAEGREVARADLAGSVCPGAPLDLGQALAVDAPHLWDVDDPYLYTLRTTLLCDGEVADCLSTTFGLRTLRWDADEGFFLNGRPLKLKGTCNHQDHAGVGVAVPDAVQEYRIRRLREMGGNAYRCAHNPPTPELLDACDRLGMLVMDENRHLDSTVERLEDLRALIRRDRNHPCVILWSLFNEERLQGGERGARIAATMKREILKLDPTRPVTAAMSDGWEGPVSPLLDVEGYNYSIPRYDPYHAAHPTHPMFGSETCSTVTTRGIYANDPEKGYMQAYDLNNPGWGSFAEEGWKAIAERPFMGGTFVWTGFDYRGEPTPYQWPCINSHFGIMDTCGFPKDNFFYYQAWWTDQPVLHILPHWNWPERLGEEIVVWVHSNCDKVELFLNGASLGAQEMERNGHLEWQVKYAPGRLEAHGWKDGAEVAVEIAETTGPAAQIRLAPHQATLRADGEDVAVVWVSLHDEQGRLAPTADEEVRFAVSDNARIIGVGNGDPSSHEPDKATRRRAFHGWCQVLVQAGREAGEVVLTASGVGLLPARLVLPAEACEARPAVLAVPREASA